MLIIFAEILFALLAPFLAAIGAIVALIFEVIAVFLGSLFDSSGGRSRRRKSPEPRKTPEPAKPSGIRTESHKTLKSNNIFHWIVGGLGMAAATVVIASFVLFDPLLRMMLTKGAERAAVELTYEESAGSLFFGQVTLSDVTLRRGSDEGLAFDLSVSRIEADVDVFSLLGGEPRIEFAGVNGVSGSVTPPEPNKQQVVAGGQAKSARRPFRVDLADISDVALDIRPRTTESYRLTITTGQVAPFRSRLAMFDLLFRSNLEASIAEQSLRVSTREISERGRETIWNFEDVEVDQLKLVLPKAPLTWLSDGTVTARVEDRWDLTDDEIDMDWRIRLDDIVVTPPATAGQAERLLAGGLAKAVERQGGSADFQYQLELGPEQVAALRNGDISAFWDTVLSGVLSPSAIRISADRESNDAEGSGRVRNALDTLRERFRQDRND